MARRWLSSIWLDLLISLLVAIAEAAMIAPWLHLLAGLRGAPGSAVPSPVGLVVVGLASFWAARLLLGSGWDLGAARGISLGIWLVLMIGWFGIRSGTTFTAPWVFVDRLVSLNGGVVALLIAGGVAWWRGTMLGAEPDPFRPDLARRLVGRGILVAGVALVLAALAGGATARQVAGSASAALPLLLIASLAAAGAIQVRTARAMVKSTDPARGLGWLGAATGLAVGMLLVALAIAGIAGRRVWAQVFAPFGELLHLLGLAASWLLLGIAYVLFLILSPVFWLLHKLVGQPANQLPQPIQPGANQFDRFTQNAHSAFPAWAIDLLKFGGVALLVGIVLWLALRSLRRYRANPAQQAVDEVHESVWSRDLALAQLKGLLRGRGPRERRGPAKPFDLDAEPRTVREAYQHLLVLGVRAGEPRRPTESALDYAARLSASWSDLAEPVEDLTRRYLTARYGDLERPEDVEPAKRDWQVIRRQARAGSSADGRRG